MWNYETFSRICSKFLMQKMCDVRFFVSPIILLATSEFSWYIALLWICLFSLWQDETFSRPNSKNCWYGRETANRFRCLPCFEAFWGYTAWVWFGFISWKEFQPNQIHRILLLNFCFNDFPMPKFLIFVQSEVKIAGQPISGGFRGGNCGELPDETQLDTSFLVSKAPLIMILMFSF